eukprot:CAMPEP_0177586048 /NCGR_PEP_ID=MMETSP0419_2-20121207/4852_1 /TAXON_ID=582737 /ORGANISM="Tetraselmis sp., Strain GSL018" /LENGTH=81 /DNA_ID=CAMNT_0019075889 /DNA_START=361 /DNA_END=604 /DNA_ORIENTATION=+
MLHSVHHLTGLGEPGAGAAVDARRRAVPAGRQRSHRIGGASVRRASIATAGLPETPRVGSRDNGGAPRSVGAAAPGPSGAD